MEELYLNSNTDFYKYVLHFIFVKYSEKIKQFEYLSQTNIKPYEYIRRNDIRNIKVCYPLDCDFEINYKGKMIHFYLETVKKNGNLQTLLKPAPGCNGSMDEIILKKVKLVSEDKEVLLRFVDDAKKFCDEEIKESKKSEAQTIKINMWRKEYWNLLFNSPKRPIETLYLKEGQKENIIQSVEDFYNPDTRSEYLSHGIPYKSVILLYGPPGTGKTTTINIIASHFDCDVYVIPISKELTDYGLIDAIAYLEEKEEKKRIIVIEDIDSIFTDRKKGDDDNGITLQGLLNCFDGFSCVEGTLLFITANKPEVIDNALFRSCRVDHKYQLDYADEYQTKCIFERMVPKKDKGTFSKFYKLVNNKEYTTAMLQEFLFFNRKEESIYGKMNDFNDIINKSKSDYFDKKKDNLYM